MNNNLKLITWMILLFLSFNLVSASNVSTTYTKASEIDYQEIHDSKSSTWLNIAKEEFLTFYSEEQRLKLNKSLNYLISIWNTWNTVYLIKLSFVLDKLEKERWEEQKVNALIKYIRTYLATEKSLRK